MSQDNSSGFGNVHIAAAPQTQKQIGLEVTGHGDRVVDGVNRWFRLTTVKDLDTHVRTSQRGADLIDQPRFDECLVGDDEHSAGFHSSGDLTQLADGAAAKQ